MLERSGSARECGLWGDSPCPNVRFGHEYMQEMQDELMDACACGLMGEWVDT